MCVYTQCNVTQPSKRGEILFAATWINLEIITLSEVSQAKKDKYYIIVLICGI